MDNKKCALVIGKMMDFHIGHMALIKFAMENAAKVKVVLCYTTEDRVHIARRLKLVRRTFGESIELSAFDYKEYGLEGGEVSDVDISKEWAKWVVKEMPQVDLLVGSEDYVQYMAEAADMDYLIYDKERSTHSCSSTGVSKGDFNSYAPESKVENIKVINLIGFSPEEADLVHFLMCSYAEGRVEFHPVQHGNSDSFSTNKLKALDCHKSLISNILNCASPFLLNTESAVQSIIDSMDKFGEYPAVLRALVDDEPGVYVVNRSEPSERLVSPIVAYCLLTHKKTIYNYDGDNLKSIFDAIRSI